MDWDDYRKRFENEAQRQGMPASFVLKALGYAEPLARAGLPIVYDFAHLSSLLGFQESALREAIREPSLLYNSYSIPKRSVGYRRIDEPVPSLKMIQRWILDFILNQCRPHDAAMAFRRGRSIRQNAELHLAQRMVLSLDVKDFFSSISEARVMGVFRNLGYSSEVVEALTTLTVLRGGLPQGAPTSPALSNIIMNNADEILSQYATRLRIRYSRYADDMTFSGVFRVGGVIATVRRVLERHGLMLNEAKTRLMLRHQRQEVTGVVVNKRLQVPRQVRRSLRQEAHYIDRFGFQGHQDRVSAVRTDRLSRLWGIAEFVLFINPDDYDARMAIEVFERAVRLQSEQADELGEGSEEDRYMFLRLLHTRFGELPATVVARIEAASLPDLKRWTERVLAAQTLAEVFDAEASGDR